MSSKPTSHIIAERSHIELLAPLRGRLSRWPAVLPSQPGDPIRPLANGTSRALGMLLVIQDESSLNLVKTIMRRYCVTPQYAEAMLQKGAMRYDLDGNPVGPVSDVNKTRTGETRQTLSKVSLRESAQEQFEKDLAEREKIGASGALSASKIEAGKITLTKSAIDKTTVKKTIVLKPSAEKTLIVKPGAAKVIAEETVVAKATPLGVEKAVAKETVVAKAAPPGVKKVVAKETVVAKVASTELLVEETAVDKVVVTEVTDKVGRSESVKQKSVKYKNKKYKFNSPRADEWHINLFKPLQSLLSKYPAVFPTEVGELIRPLELDVDDKIIALLNSPNPSDIDLVKCLLHRYRMSMNYAGAMAQNESMYYDLDGNKIRPVPEEERMIQKGRIDKITLEFDKMKLEDQRGKDTTNSYYNQDWFIALLDVIRPLLSDWPVVFPSVVEDEVKPLALGIGRKLENLLIERDENSLISLHRTLINYCRSVGYMLEIIKEGAVRYDIDGTPVGPISRDHREDAFKYMQAFHYREKNKFRKNKERLEELCRKNASEENKSADHLNEIASEETDSIKS
ncbi:hypothetical protein CCP2SC5_340007 [Azospirillaceae bacterium]